MQLEYISLTTAIDMFEEYKRDETIIIKAEFCTEGKPVHDISKEVKKNNDTLYELLKTQYNFLNFVIYDRKIPLIGWNIEEARREVILEPIINNIWWEGRLTLEVPTTCYHIRNNYDYQSSYNPTTNYDVLYCNDKIIYTELSVPRKQFVELIQKVYLPKKVELDYIT